MQNDIDIVDNQPHAVLFPGITVGNLTELLTVRPDGLPDRTDLPPGCSRADHDEVAHPADPAQIKHSDIFTLVVFGDSSKLDSELVSVVSPHTPIIQDAAPPGQPFPITSACTLISEPRAQATGQKA